MTQIRNKDIKEVTVKQDTLELVNKSDVKMSARLDASDATRDQIYAAAKETDTVINLEPPSSGLGWQVLINALAVHPAHGLSGLHAAANAGRRQQGSELWQIKGKTAQ